jgi:hypothetical protein
MKTRILVFLTMMTAAALPALAVESRPPGNLEQKKAEQLGRIEERMSRLLEEKACIQAATTHEALKACRERFRGEAGRDREKAKERRNGGERNPSNTTTEGRNP